MATSTILRAFDAIVDDVNKAERSLIAKVNTSGKDRYKTVIEPRGGNFDSFRRNPVALWEHGQDPRRFTDPIGTNIWIRHNGGQNPTHILAKTRFLGDDFSQQRFEWYRDGILNAFSIRALPQESSPATREEIRARPELDDGYHDKDGEWHPVIVYRKWELAEYSGTSVPGNADCLAERAIRVMDLVQRNLLWLPDEVKPIYEEAATRTVVSMSGLPEPDPEATQENEPVPEPALEAEPRAMTDSCGGMTGGGAAIKETSPGSPSNVPKNKHDDDENDDDDEEEEGKDNNGKPKARIKKDKEEKETDVGDTKQRDIVEIVTVTRRIVKKDEKFFVYSEDGSKKLGGPYDSEGEAKHRLEQVEYFKHKDGERSASSPETPSETSPDPATSNDPIQHDGHGGWTVRGLDDMTFPSQAIAEQAARALATPGRSLAEALNEHDGEFKRRNAAIQEAIREELQYARNEFQLREFGVV